MIWATISSRSCFCSLYIASPSLAAKNIINLISVLTIWWCPCVEFLLCCWKRVFAMTSVFSWQNSVSLCPASFYTTRANLPIIPGISWFPTFAFQPPMMKRTSFGGISSRRSCKSSSDKIRSVAQSCPTLCDPMNRSTPGLPVHHQLPEFTQTHVHRVSDAIQPSQPLSSPSPPAPNPSQHQSLFQWINSSHEVAKVLEFQL